LVRTTYFLGLLLTMATILIVPFFRGLAGAALYEWRELRAEASRPMFVSVRAGPAPRRFKVIWA